MHDDDPDINEKVRRLLHPEHEGTTGPDVSYSRTDFVDPVSAREALHEALDGLLDKMVEKRRTIGVAMIHLRDTEPEPTEDPNKCIGLVIDLDMDRGLLG